MTSTLHGRKERYAKFARALQEGEKNKHNVRILEKIADFGIVEADQLARRPTRDFDFTVVLDRRSDIDLIEVRMASATGRPSAYKRVKSVLPLTDSSPADNVEVSFPSLLIQYNYQ